MYENPDENRHLHAKCLPLFKISPIYAWKMTPFSWFREFVPAFEKLPLSSRKWVYTSVVYHKTSNIRRTLVGNKIVDHSVAVGASPVGAAPTTSSFST